MPFMYLHEHTTDLFKSLTMHQDTGTPSQEIPNLSRGRDQGGPETHTKADETRLCAFCSRKLRKNGDCDDGSHNWYPFEKRTKVVVHSDHAQAG